LSVGCWRNWHVFGIQQGRIDTTMKKILLLTGLALGFFSLSAQAQGDTEAIIQAFKSSNATEVAKYFDDFVDMKLLDKPEIKNVGRNQAGITLDAFFKENGIKGFEKASDREIGNTMYMTGKLLNNGKGYGITILLKAKDGRHQIISVRIS
jgi:hypothetical protein